MKRKEKIILGVMILLFVISTSLFLYNNVFSDIQANKNKVSVLKATKDIEKDVKLTKDNTKRISINKEDSIDAYSIKDDEINKFKSVDKIYKDEIVNKNRLISQGTDSEESISTYIINIQPDFSADIDKGDLIKVYVQEVDEDGVVSNKLVFDKKELVDVTLPEAKSNIETLKIEVSDKDALSYYKAKEVGKIIVLKYNNVSSNYDLNIPVISLEADVKPKAEPKVEPEAEPEAEPKAEEVDAEAAKPQ